MVSSQFGALLKEFESFFNCPLVPDENNSCSISLDDGLKLEIELDRYGSIVIGCRLGSVHMGRYRENLIRQALKTNNQTLPSTGIFGFSRKSNQFILFMKLNPILAKKDEIFALLPPFISKAKTWLEAIAKGEIPALADEAPKGPAGLFGLIAGSSKED